MRRAGALLFGVARQAASGGLQPVEIATWDAAAAAASSRAAWLHPARVPAAAMSSTAAAAAAASSGSGRCQTAGAAAWHAAAPPCARRISSSSREQHNAQPAAAEAEQGAEAAAPRPSAAVARNCWQCGTPLTPHDLFFCPQCESVQPASAEVQYFQVFDMDQPQFDLDVAALERQYKQLQRQLHPDKFSTASSLEQEYAHQQAAVINQAYDVLKRPLRRAHYILNQRGFGACEGMTITDPELLMYVMEAREEVESTHDAHCLRQLLEENRRLEQQRIQDLVAAFGSGDLAHAAELTTQLRYICRIQEAILEKL